MNIKRITHLLQLLPPLQPRNGADAKGLAGACEAGKRTVFRDLEALKEAGIPLEFDKNEKRYSITGSFFLAPLKFTATEAISLVPPAAEMGRSDRTQFCEAAHSAALKPEGRLPLPRRQRLQLMAETYNGSVE